MRILLFHEQIFYLLIIYSTKITAITIASLLQLDLHNKVMNNLSYQEYHSSNNPSWESTTNKINTTTSTAPHGTEPFTFNIKIVAIFIAGIIILFALIRLIFLFCAPSRSSNNSSPSNRITTNVRSQVSTIELPQFKPELPPTYHEAITNRDTDGSKLPSYDELQNQQRPHTTDSASN